MKLVAAILFFFPFTHSYTQLNVHAGDAIVGKWQNRDKNLIVEVYKENNTYKGRLLWFKNSNEKTHPSDNWRDANNPEPALRSRKLLGMKVLDKLWFNPQKNCWEGGEVYDSTTGRTWSSSARFSNNGGLEVRGFWHFEFLGKTMFFTRF